MATREQYLAKGYSNEQIDAALAAKNAGQAPVNVTPANQQLTQSPDMAPSQRPGTSSVPDAPKPAVPPSAPVTPPASVQVPPAPAAPAAPKPEVSAPPAPEVAPTPAPAAPKVETPAPVSPVAPAAPKPVQAAPSTAPKTQEYFDQSQKREQEILTNLNEGFKNAPELFRDVGTFRSSYGYDTADEGKKKMLDAFWQSKQPKGENQFADILLSGGTVWNSDSKRTPDYQRAQARYDVVSQYKGADSNSLFSAMANGKITPNSEAYRDLVKVNGGVETPAMLEAKAKYEKKKITDWINRSASVLGAAATGTDVPEPQNHSDVLGADIAARKGIDYAQAYKDSIANDPELQKLNQELSATSAQIKELERVKAETMKGIVSQYKGITTGAAMLLANQQNEAIDKNLNQLYDRQANQNANLTYRTNIAEKAFDYKIEQDKLDRAEASQIAQENRAFERQKQLATFQQGIALDTNQKEFEQKLAQQAQIASDPVTATQAVIDQYRAKGILAGRSDAEIIQSVKNDIAGGMTLGQSLTNLNQAFQSKPEYKAAMAPKTELKEFGGDLYRVDANNNLTKVLSGTTKATESWTKLNDTTLFNQVTGKTMNVSDLTKWASASDLLNVPSGTVIPSRLGQTTNANGGKECAEYVNDITHLGMGDSYASKIAKTDTQNPADATVGNVAVWNPNPSNPEWNKYGHAGVIVGESGDKWLIKSSNLMGDGAVTEDWIPKSSIYSYNTKVKAVAGEKQLEPLTDKQFTQMNQTKTSFKSDPEVKKFEEALNQAGNLAVSLNSANWPGDIGAVFQFMKSLDPQSVVREGEFAMAAKSAGLWDYFKNIPSNKWEGTTLTPEQRKQFGVLAKSYVKQMGSSYQREYDDMARILTGMKIQKEYWPTNAFEQMNHILDQSSPAQSQNAPANVPTDFLDLYKKL